MILVFVVSGIVLFITSEIVIPAMKIHKENTLLKKENIRLEEEVDIFKEIFTQQKSYPLRPKYPRQGEEMHQIIPILKVSKNGEIEMAISPHKLIREFQHRLNGPTRTMKNRRTTPESILIRLFQDKLPMNSPINSLQQAA